MKKQVIKSILFTSLFFPFCSFSAFTPTSNGMFATEDSKQKVYFPCTMGGEPLVIYSITSKAPISSKDAIWPSYVKPGYVADPLTVSSDAQSELTSSNYLITRSPNPANEHFYLKFGLRKENGDDLFYVETVNFASVNTNANYKVVSAYRVSTDDSVIYQSFFPVKEIPGSQDTGVIISKTLKNIKAYQYSWDQNTDWRDINHLDAFSKIQYNFSPIQTRPDTFAGLGFWICGSDAKEQDVKALPQSSETVYQDKLN